MWSPGTIGAPRPPPFSSDSRVPMSNSPSIFSPLWHFTHFACRMPRTDVLNSSVPFAIFATWSGSTGLSFAWGEPGACATRITSAATGNRRAGRAATRHRREPRRGREEPYRRDTSSLVAPSSEVNAEGENPWRPCFLWHGHSCPCFENSWARMPVPPGSDHQSGGNSSLPAIVASAARIGGESSPFTYRTEPSARTT